MAVVIPYYQRQPGLLQACVGSILAQQSVPPCEVIVVDDSSPHPATDELAELLPQHPQIRVIVQANAGPGAARNRGLAEVRPGTRFVAFLDSDDEWTPDYAATAQAAFEAGADLFFANSRRYGNERTRFEWAQGSGTELVAAEHEPIAGVEGLHLYQGDFFDFAIRRSGIISTSTLAFRFEHLPGLRFESRLFNGQDRFFKLQLAQHARRCAFGLRVGATEGRGINIFDSSQWGSGKSLNLLLNYLRLTQLILAELPLSASQRAHVLSQRADLRADVASTVMHQLRNRIPVRRDLLWQCVRADPGTGWMFVPNVVRALWRRVVGARQQPERNVN
jgi:succinoglycan biosynthesis protein ExoW